MTVGLTYLSDRIAVSTVEIQDDPDGNNFATYVREEGPEWSSEMCSRYVDHYSAELGHRAIASALMLDLAVDPFQ